MKNNALYLDSGFYTVSDRAAGALCRVTGHKLPKTGHEKFVMIRTDSGHKLNAWLSRADVRSGVARQIKRGWVWAIHGLRFDGAEPPVTLGNRFCFEPITSTQS